MTWKSIGDLIMDKVYKYRGYEIKAYSRAVAIQPAAPTGGFERYGSITLPGSTEILDPGGKIYQTKDEADEAFIDFAKGYIDRILD